MKGIVIIILLSIIYSKGSARPYKPPEIAPNVVIPSVDQGTVMVEEQSVSLSYCDLLIDKYTVYLCSNKLFVVNESSIVGLPSVNQMEDKFVMNVHMDDSIILKIGPRTIDVVREFELIEKIYFRSDLLLIARVKTKPEYFILMTIIKKSGSSSDEQEVIRKPSSSPYYVSIFLRGAMPTSHQLSFPIEKFDFVFNDNSFKDAIIYSDPWSGHNYFIVSLEKAWLGVFKSPFESSSVSFLFAQQLERDWEIIDMKICESYLVLLVESEKAKGLKVLSYKIQTNSFDDLLVLEKEGELILNSYFYSTYAPQLRVKMIDQVFVIMINIPGEKVITYYYRRPLFASFSLQAPSGPFEIVYKNSIGTTNKLGYSFDYDAQKNGFLLTPITPGLKSTYFVEYCLPNFYLDTNRGCVRCASGFSFGGIASSCQTCDVFLDNPLNFAQNSSIVEINCPIQCEKGKFGKMCLSCFDEMNSLTSKSLSKQNWILDEFKGDCSLNCELPNVPHPKIGRCLNESTLAMINDNCAQISDCVECSLTQTCSWAESSCQRKNQSKKSISEDFLKPASNCPAAASKVCGESELTGSAGVIQFSTSQRKSTFCKWSINSQNTDQNRIELRVILENSTSDVPPMIYFESYDHHNSKSKMVNAFSVLEMKNGHAHKNLVGSEVMLYAVIDQNTDQDTIKFRVEYRIRPNNDFIEGVLILFKWVYYTIFFFLMTGLAFATTRKVIRYCQRRRLLEEFEDLEIGDGEQQKLKIENALKTNKVMERVVFEDAQSNKYGQTECSICLEEFHKGENLAKFSCEHIFHISCFENWVKLSNFHSNIKCAVCNRVLI